MSMHDVSAGRRRIVCSAVKESGTCTNTRRYYLDQIEHVVVDALIEELDRPVLIERLVAGYVASHRNEIAEAHQNLSHLQSRRNKAIAAQRRLLGLVEQGLEIEELDKRLRELDSEARDLAHQIALAEGEEPPPVALDTKEVRRYVGDLERVFENLALGEAPASEEVRLLFATLLANVTIGPMENADILPINITIRIGPLMEINGKSVFPGDKGTQSLIDELLGRTVVAEEGFEPPTQGL
jgi:site-specific DNA recombinase